MNTIGAVLAGGRSSRFGTPKCLAPLAGRTLVEIVLEAQQEVFDRAVIISNEPDMFASFDAPVISDITPYSGPLGGIRTALQHAAGGSICCAPCDAPFVTPSLFRLLRDGAEGVDAVIPLSTGPLGYEPLFAWYSGATLPSLVAFMDAGGRAAHEFVEQLTRVRFIPRDILDDIGGTELLFINVNTPADLAQAGQRLGERRLES